MRITPRGETASVIVAVILFVLIMGLAGGIEQGTFPP